MDYQDGDVLAMLQLDIEMGNSGTHVHSIPRLEIISKKHAVVSAEPTALGGIERGRFRPRLDASDKR